MTKGWSEERRRRQAENIRKTRPWEKATGPKTEEGKEACRMNAWKHGNRSAARRTIDKGLRLQRQFLQQIVAYLAAEEQEEMLQSKRTERERRKNNGIEADA